MKFQGVEMWGREPHVGEVYDYNRARLCRRMCEERGLEVAALGSYLRFGVTKRSTETGSLLDTLNTAHTLRAPIIRVWASDVASDKADAALWQRVVAEARDAAHRSRKLEVVLAVEMHDETLADTSASALRLVEEVACDNFRLNYQPTGRPGAEDNVARLKAVFDHVVHVHAQSFQPGPLPNGEGPRRAGLRDGVVDFPAIVQVLLRRGYSGWLALEFAAVEGNGKCQALARDLTYLRELVKA
jgi:3-dehydroshikimate dehydratase